MSPTWLHWPSTWTPAELGALQAWFKADDLASISLSGSLVESWVNVGPNSGSYEVSAAGSARPLYVPNGAPNGLPVIRFDGVSTGLAAPSNNLFQNIAGGTIYAVRSQSSSTGWQSVVAVMQSLTTARAIVDTGRVTNTIGAGGRRIESDPFLSVNSPTGFGTGWRIQGAVFDYVGTTLSIYVDGVLNGSDPAFQSSGLSQNTNNEGLRIGSYVSHHLSGDASEIIIVHAAVSAADREKLEGYLAWKWGLESNLPSTHPYRNSAP